MANVVLELIALLFMAFLQLTPIIAFLLLGWAAMRAATEYVRRGSKMYPEAPKVKGPSLGSKIKAAWTAFKSL